MTKYIHTNLIAKDYRKLADFYIKVFNCQPKPPKRNLSGKWIDDITAIPNVQIEGIHLILPGTEDVTLEIFQYNPEDNQRHKAINQQGFAHIAFHVDNVEEMLQKVLDYGGGQLGDIVIKDYEDIGTLTIVYATDPEGNFVELQNWILT